MATVTRSLCQGCGRSTRHLYGEGLRGPENCALCHLQDLATEEQDARTQLQMIADVVRDAVVHSCVHPEDIREEVERALQEPSVAEWAPRRKRWLAVHDERQAFAEMLSGELMGTVA